VASDEHASGDQRAGEDRLASGIRPVNPYIAGAPVSGREMFFGRDDVFAFIRRKLIGQHRDTPIVLKGERRTGKTSVLYQVRRHLDPAYRCVSVDLHGLSLNGIGDLLNGIAASVSEGLRTGYAVDVAPPGRLAFEADPRSAFESVFLAAVLEALGEGHLVLMLDEVARLDEEVRAGRLEREVFNYLRHLMQHYPRLTFIFSLGNGLEEMQKDYAFLFSGAMYHEISFLEEAAARKLITDPVQGCLEVSPDAVDAILRVASGHPYYTQLVCHSLFDRWSGAPKPAMTAEDVYAVLGEAVELGSPNLTYVWEDSSPEEKAVMAAMAAAMRAGPRAVTGAAIRDAWRKAGIPLPQRRLSAALRSLASREVITGTESYSFTVDLQRLWLDKHRRPDWVKDELAGPIQQWARETRPRYLAALITPMLASGHPGNRVASQPQAAAVRTKSAFSPAGARDPASARQDATSQARRQSRVSAVPARDRHPQDAAGSGPRRPQMARGWPSIPHRRRLGPIIAGGAALVLVAGGLIGWKLVSGGTPASSRPATPSSTSGAVNSGACTPVNNATSPVPATPSAGSGSGAFLNINKAAVPNCSEVTLAGGGFARHETVYLQETGPAGENIGRATPVTTNANGDIGPLSYIVRADEFNTGRYSISATGANPSGGSASASINIEQT
jgi:hypothetical protein